MLQQIPGGPVEIHTWKAEEVRVPNAMLVLKVSAPPKTFLTVNAPYYIQERSGIVLVH